MTYVEEGALINITCIVEGKTRIEPPDQIFWYHKGEVIFFEQINIQGRYNLVYFLQIISKVI